MDSFICPNMASPKTLYRPDAYALETICAVPNVTHETRNYCSINGTLMHIAQSKCGETLPIHHTPEILLAYGKQRVKAADFPDPGQKVAAAMPVGTSSRGAQPDQNRAQGLA